ncbi:hypothetical protein ACFL2V_11100 [Pseudomonadota bacterium]
MLRKNYIDNKLQEPIVYYCKDCEKVVDTKPVGRKFVYKCAICGTKNVAFGTEKSVTNYYRVEEEAEKVAKAQGKEEEAAKEPEKK